MHSVVRTVFARLHVLDPRDEEEKLALASDEPTEGEIKMTVSKQEIPVEIAEGEVIANNTKEDEVIGDQQEIAPEAKHLTEDPETGADRTKSRTACKCPSQRPELDLIPPTVGLPSILELLRVLVNVLDPNDQQHTDSTRLVALGVLNTAFEESGTAIAEFPSLKALIVDPGSKFLFQLARSENMTILQSTLRTISTILFHMRKHLKLQQELFLAFTIDRLVLPLHSGRSLKKGQSPSPRPGTPATSETSEIESNLDKAHALTPRVHAPTPRVHAPPARGEMRDLILETLNHISDHPSFMVDLYTNYDCDINCENLFERLVDFLTTVSVI